MRRIGRPANPAERGYQHVIENAHVLDHVACNLFQAVEGYKRRVDLVWEAMPEAEREVWRVDALRRLRDHVAAYTPRVYPPDPPNPGARKIA